MKTSKVFFLKSAGGAASALNVGEWGCISKKVENRLLVEQQIKNDCDGVCKRKKAVKISFTQDWQMLENKENLTR
jgi:hypothetical protein